MRKNCANGLIAAVIAGGGLAFASGAQAHPLAADIEAGLAVIDYEAADDLTTGIGFSLGARLWLGPAYVQGLGERFDHSGKSNRYLLVGGGATPLSPQVELIGDIGLRHLDSDHHSSQTYFGARVGVRGNRDNLTTDLRLIGWEPDNSAQRFQYGLSLEVTVSAPVDHYGLVIHLEGLRDESSARVALQRRL